MPRGEQILTWIKTPTTLYTASVAATLDLLDYLTFTLQFVCGANGSSSVTEPARKFERTNNILNFHVLLRAFQKFGFSYEQFAKVDG